MRALRVVGVTGDGSVVLEDPGRRERYTVPADEQLRAAARGDVTRLGQIAIELESQLRPREIQARIRGGASVDEVAAAAGVPTQKIERFAYPVLLERSRTAELAQGAHPQRADGPDSRTLGETVAHTFGLRGQDYGGAGWDSWKGEDGKWVVVLTWQTGRSDNAAHWAFQPGAHGGTVVALDEHASDLVEGLPARPLRPLGAVVDMARDEDHTPQAPMTAAPARAVAAAGGQQPEAWAGRGIAPEQRRASPPPPRTRVETPTRTVTTRSDETRAPAAAAPVVPKRAEQTDDTSAPASASDEPTGAVVPEGSGDASSATEAAPADTVADGASASDEAAASEQVTPATSTTVAASDRPVTGSARTDSDTTDAGTAGPGAADPGDADSGAADDATSPAGTSTSASTPGTPAAADRADDTAPVPDPAPETTEPADTSRDTTDRAAAATGTATDDTPSTSTPSTGAADSDATSTPAATAAAGDTQAPAEHDGTAAATDGDTPAASSTGGTPTDDAATDAAPTGTGPTGTGSTGTTAAEEPEPAPSQDDGAAAADENAPPRRTPSAGSRRTKKGKPVMPSWDEVLLGVRGQR